MSGHSKFSNIKHKKEKSDAARGKVFTKLGRELMVAVKEGGADPDGNGKLREIIAKCKSNNMPNDTIQRSIKKASGEGMDVEYESVIYEGYGPGGVAIIVECLTENRNRTAANVRHAFSKNGGNMGNTGCVSFMFDKKGRIVIDMEEGPGEDELMELGIEAGAEDVVCEDGICEMLTAPEDFDAVYSAVEKAGIPMMEAQITKIAQNTTSVSEEDAAQLEKLLDMLDDDDDVQDVFNNWDN